MNLAGFDLNLLLVFDALMSERSVTRAGARIGLSQPAVSAALGRLRHAFKDELFVRLHGGMAPTPRAVALAEPIREALARLEAALPSGAGFDARRARRRFTLMGADYVSFVLAPPLMRSLAEAAPGIELRVIDAATGGIAHLLDAGTIDAAIDIAQDQPEAIRSRFLMPERYVCAAAAENSEIAGRRLPEGAVLPLDLYCELRHALRSVTGAAAGAVDAALAAIHRRRRVVLTLPHFAAVAQAVAGGQLVAALPERLARALAPGFGLRLYELPVELGPLALLLYWHRRRDEDAGHVWLRQQIVSLAETLNGRKEI